MPTKKQQQLTLQSLLLGFTATYSKYMPENEELGDRWRDIDGNTYKVYRHFEDTQVYSKDSDEIRIPDWVTVSSKEFYSPEKDKNLNINPAPSVGSLRK